MDLTNEQLYLGLDNQTLVSSEEVMDDPFLALRTKHSRSAGQVDFTGWQELAQFEILEPTSAIPLIFSREEPALPEVLIKGFDLYPCETLVFETPAACSELAAYECRIKHILNLEKRPHSHYCQYASPFPLQKIENRSSASIKLVDQQVEFEKSSNLYF